LWGTLLVGVLYGVIRRSLRRWWVLLLAGFHSCPAGGVVSQTDSHRSPVLHFQAAADRAIRSSGMLTRWGAQWGIRDLQDWASLPVLLFVITVLAFFASCIQRSESLF